MKVISRTVPHTGTASRVGRWLTNGVRPAQELWAAIETRRAARRLPGWTTASWCLPSIRRPWTAPAIGPDEWAKSDPFDARVLATFLRTDHGHLAPLRPSSEAAQESGADTRLYPPRAAGKRACSNQISPPAPQGSVDAVEVARPSRLGRRQELILSSAFLPHVAV